MEEIAQSELFELGPAEFTTLDMFKESFYMAAITFPCSIIFGRVGLFIGGECENG